MYSSPCDPIFYLHHLFVDHQFSTWQDVSIARKQTLTNTGKVDLNTVLDMNGLRANGKVSDVIDTQGGLLCYKYDY